MDAHQALLIIVIASLTTSSAIPFWVVEEGDILLRGWSYDGKKIAPPNNERQKKKTFIYEHPYPRVQGASAATHNVYVFKLGTCNSSSV
jgi:hypothetical protein